jgi:hypothetical protein
VYFVEYEASILDMLYKTSQDIIPERDYLFAFIYVLTKVCKILAQHFPLGKGRTVSLLSNFNVSLCYFCIEDTRLRSSHLEHF